jgi:hypothetical protein
MATATDDIYAAYSHERPSRGPWPSEAPPTGVLTGVLEELAFYYGACWLYYGSTPHRNEILGRDSTAEEIEYLRTETPPHLRRPPSS